MNENHLSSLANFCVGIGDEAWRVYVNSEFGQRRLLALKTESERKGAHKLFLLGLGCRVFVPPDAEDEDDNENLWQQYLRTQEGNVILDGPAYPDTPGIILHYAKEFFIEGCRVGEIALRQCAQ